MAIPDKRPLKVFLCHAHADRDAVHALYNRLVKDGVDAWFDKEKLLPGQDWELEIKKAVREADVVVVCLSKQFNQAGFRQKEVRLALDTAMEKPEGEIFIIPARLEECDTLESLRKWHWVDLFESDGYERLMRALQTRAHRIGAVLQVKRSWLPKITSPRSEPKKSIEDKRNEEPKRKSVETQKDNLNNLPSSPENFPDDWEAQWQSGFVKTSKDEKVKLEIPEEETAEVPDIKVEKPSTKKKRQIRKPNTAIIVALIGFAGTVIVGLLGSPLLENWFSPMPVMTESVTASFTSPSQLVVPSQTPKLMSRSETPTITIMPAKVYTSTATPYPTEISDAKGITMHLVPAGEFTMGSDADDVLIECQKYRNDCNPDWFKDEQPPHLVYLEDFYMDIYEVTNAAYRACVDVGGCTPPHRTSSSAHDNYYGNLKFDNYPVIYIDWHQAKTYCEWRGGSLPTEAQWEKSARGSEAHTYPWGEGIDCTKANYTGKNGNCVGDTTPVGSYESGKSPYGIYDMAGNVWEWVNDWYDDVYYQSSPSSNPFGPDSGTSRVVRGGSRLSLGLYVRSALRDNLTSDFVSNLLGFRCARPTP